MECRQFGRFGPLVAALELNTRAARATIFAANTSEMLTYHEIPVETIYPKEGWAEQSPIEILEAVIDSIEIALDNLRKLDINPVDIVSVGISNQRETIITWDIKSGLPYYNAILWLDTRSSETVEELMQTSRHKLEDVRMRCGLPLSSYFSAPKLRWLIDNTLEIKPAIDEGRCIAGTVDSWLIWNLTGGNRGGIHITDVTNASRTMLMNIEHQTWDRELCDFFGIPPSVLPTIKSSSEIYGYIFIGSLTGIPISGCLGNQQASLVGQMCLEFGQTKCTFGSGAFLLCNTGTSLIRSTNGLATTIAYKFGPSANTRYALEASGIIAGITFDWMKSTMEIIDKTEGLQNMGENRLEIDLKAESIKTGLLKKLRNKIEDHDPDEDGTIYFVPALSGLFAPYWRNDARGLICGMSPNTHISHIVLATSRALGFQTRAMIEALGRDCNRRIKRILVDGPLAGTSSLMQMQADICGTQIVRPIMSESAALGAAIAAGSASGINIWPKSCLPPPSDVFYPTTNEDERDVLYDRWNMAVNKSLGWCPETLEIYKSEDESKILQKQIYSSIPSGLFIISSFILLLLAENT